MTGGAKYQLVIDWVKARIADGTYVQGDRLMSENELCEKFGLSRQTVRHATGELEKQKIVTRVRGSGTYIGGAYLPVRAERHMNVSLVSTFYENYIFPPTIKGIERVLSKNGYSLQVSFTDNRVSRERQILENILEKDHIDALIVEPAKSALPNPNLALYEEFRRRRIPVLFFNAVYPGLDFSCVRLDDEKAGYDAAKILIDAGHTDIGGIFKSDDRQGHLRYAGFLRAVSEAGLHVSQTKVVWLDTPMTTRLEGIESHLLDRMGNATGIVCYNDNVAGQLVTICERHGIRIPEDLSLVGIDDAALAGRSFAGLTTIPHPKELLGQKTAENILQMIQQPDFDGGWLFRPEPIIRNSVKKLVP
ncbi:MAG: GntR family transcriptional regulator [Lachnospiraceae bacterium]|nr:GntR family transcriptional regulator [Lachnospiraceae bacterium]